MKKSKNSIWAAILVFNMFSDKINKGVNGEVIIPGDKSISHRSIIIPSISNGICKVSNILKSEDVLHTLNAFKLMGVKIEETNNDIIIHGNGLESLKKPNKEIYLGNSGTSARLLTGLLASQKFDTRLTGDDSLSSRPMKRITDPLSLMNANIITTNGKLPVLIKGNELQSNKININIPSAQIKSGLILAAINTKGRSTIIENGVTRDHTEIMLESFGANISLKKINGGKEITIEGKKELISKDINVPSDLSSSAFFIIAALIHKNSRIKIKNVNVNPTRNGILIALKKMGAKINIYNKRMLNNEIISDLEVLSSDLKGCELDKDFAKLMIDEYPILSIAASFAETPSIFRGLSELKVKESNRLELIKLNLLRCGVECKVNNDDLFIFPNKNISIINNNIDTNYDHRIAMAFTIMASKIGKLKINESDSINTSFPSFISEFTKIGGKIS